MTEIWKDVVGYEGRYQVSNMGRVRSLGFAYNCGHRNEQTNKTEQKIISTFKTNDYHIVSLSNGKRRKNHLVSRLVWEAFNGTIPEGMQVNHIDENKSNNCLSNLNLMTPKDNCNWGTRNKRFSKKQKKHILQSDMNDNPIFCYFSVKDAELDINGKYTGNISRCCNGKLNHSYGFKWQYLD